MNFTWFTQIGRSIKLYIYHCCMLCLTDPGGCWRFSNLASAEKSDFALKWGTFSSSRCVAGDSPSASLSQTYHRRIRLFKVEQGRRVTLFFSFIPLEPLRPCFLAVGGEKKSRVKTLGKEEKRHRDTRSPLFFQVDTVGIADSQKLGCNCLFYLESKAK